MATTGIPLAFFQDLLSPTHIVFILVIALLLFGKRLPEVARGLGKSFGEFQKGLHEGKAELNAMLTDKPDQQNLPQPPQTTASNTDQKSS